jgi:hypothetical protein
VFGTRTAWPDLIVAAIMATLGITGGVQILPHSLAELKQPKDARPLALAR